MYSLSCDIGGTFTDFALINLKTGEIVVEKSLSVPEDPSIGVRDGVLKLMKKIPGFLGDVQHIIHGTTIVINAVIERKGAKTALITTKGFRDILEIRREIRYDIYDLLADFQKPLVPRYLRKEVDERLNSRGEVVRNLEEGDLHRLFRELLDEKVESVAVCLLHSYMNPLHEICIENIATKHYPQLSISISSKVLPEIREYERTSTTVLNAYVKPLFSRYVKEIKEKLEPLGFRKELFLLLSNGGLVPAKVGESFPVRSIESGPVGGVMLAQNIGKLTAGENQDMLSFDMGGTTAKACLIKNGTIPKSKDYEVARMERFKKGSGIPVVTPVIELLEIGAGGGSIAKINEMGLLQVGPKSSGADPGPACYGRGGASPCVTDADLVLGYLDPEFFLGGEMKLDREAALRSIDKSIAAPLRISATEAAYGIHNIVNENMALAAKIHMAEKGGDPLRTAMVAFGGAGPVHAYGLAKKLRMKKVILPLRAGVASAIGFFSAPFNYELVHTYRVSLDEANLTEMEGVFERLKKDSIQFLPPVDRGERIVYDLFMDMHYKGQGYDISVPLDHPLSQTSKNGITEKFSSIYETIYGRRCPDKVEIMNLRVIATAPGKIFSFKELEVNHEGRAQSAQKGVRKAYSFLSKCYLDFAVYDRYLLKPGMSFPGPAIVEEKESTVILGQDGVASVDGYQSIVIALP